MKVKLNKEKFVVQVGKMKVVSFPIFQCAKCNLPCVRNADEEYLIIEPNPNCHCWDDEDETYDPTKAVDLSKFEA